MIMPIIKSRLRYVIIDVDTQEHFFKTTSTVCVHNHRQILANILRVMNWAKTKRIRVISTVQTLADNYCYCPAGVAQNNGEGKICYTIRRQHASYEANDFTDIQPQLLELYNQVIFHKRCFDPFEEPRVDRMLTELQAEEFVLIGAATEGAVKATALGLLSRGKNVTVLVNAIGSYNDYKGQIALRVILERGGKLFETKTFLNSVKLQPLKTCYYLVWP